MTIFAQKITTENEMLLLGNMYVVSRALHTVTELKIPDLFEGRLPKSVEMLAKQCGMPQLSLKKLLRVLSPFGIFYENSDGTFCLEKVGEMLQSNHPSGMRNLLFCEDCRWNSFGQMSQSLTTGQTGFFALYKQEYFDYIALHPDFQAGFDSHMKAVSAKEDPVLAEFLPLGEKKKVIDVGGGRGGLLKAILLRNPHLSGGVFDLPGVATEEKHRLAQEFEGRIENFSGSFFEALPFSCEAIILKRVLHDWDDTRCVQILSHCRQALCETRSSEIYVIESLVKGREDPPLLRIFDLLLRTVFGGVERTVEDYVALFSQANLKLHKSISTDCGMSILVAKQA